MPMMNLYEYDQHKSSQSSTLNYLANNLRVLRQRLDMSQQDLADRVGLNRGNIASYEAGSAEPKICNLLRISKFFSISIADLTEQDLSCEEVLQDSSDRYAQISDADREVLASFGEQAKKIEQFVHNMHHCYQFKAGSIAEPTRENQVLMAYIDQMHEAAIQILQQHQELIDFVRCRLK